MCHGVVINEVFCALNNLSYITVTQWNFALSPSLPLSLSLSDEHFVLLNSLQMSLFS